MASHPPFHILPYPLGLLKVVGLLLIQSFPLFSYAQAPVAAPPQAEPANTPQPTAITEPPANPAPSVDPALPPPPPPPPDQSLQPSENPDEQVKFRFTFEGDSQPPTVGSKPEEQPPPPPQQVPAIDMTDYLGHDPNQPVTYSLEDDEEVETVKREKSKAGLQWDQLAAQIEQFGDWFVANIVWTGPTSGVISIAMVSIFVLGNIKRKKQLKAIQDQFAQRTGKSSKKFAGSTKVKSSKGKLHPPAGKGPSKPPPVAVQSRIGDHCFLCFTGYDEIAAQTLIKRLGKAGYDIRCRKLDNGSAKIFDIETVDTISSARAVLLLASESAYKSERVQQEIEHARDEEKLIIPIYLDDSELPKHFNFLGDDPDFVYFNPDDARNSIRDVVDFLAFKELPPV